MGRRERETQRGSRRKTDKKIKREYIQIERRKGERERERKNTTKGGFETVNPNCGCLNFQARETLTPKKLWSQTSIMITQV